MPSQVGCCRKEADNVKILVVDDHPLIRSAMRDVLKEVKGDAAMLEASSCSQAMQVIAEHPDLELILLDLNLPVVMASARLPNWVSAVRLFRWLYCPPSRTVTASTGLSTSAR
jgi:CheY-like chemotaxis protein